MAEITGPRRFKHPIDDRGWAWLAIGLATLVAAFVAATTWSGNEFSIPDPATAVGSPHDSALALASADASPHDSSVLALMGTAAIVLGIGGLGLIVISLARLGDSRLRTLPVAASTRSVTRR